MKLPLRLSSLFWFALSLTGPMRAEFDVDPTPPPAAHPAPAPADGTVVAVNPPALVWRDDSRAAGYIVEFSPTADFGADVIRVEGVPHAFYNHSAALRPGRWFWRYFVIARDGTRSRPGPVSSFLVPGDATVLPLPRTDDLLATRPDHPRIFTTPDTLAEFRARREGAGRLAWEQVRLRAAEALKAAPARPEMLPLPKTFPTHRRQVFWLDPESGTAFVPKDYGMAELLRDAERANLLSLAYLISGEARYAAEARQWLRFVADFRMDYHLRSVAERGQHDTVVYAYERGVRSVAFAYDRLHALLPPPERAAALAHVKYHGEAALHWIRDVMHLHRDYQDSHGQQCMHYLLATALAVAGDLPAAREWLDYMVPQYANRLPWMSDDGGYFEGQSYAYKLSYILEALAALRTAGGLDLFQKPELRNAGQFWLYAQSLNYWWPHWGDNMGLWYPFGCAGDGFISGLLAAMTGNRSLQWFSEAVPADPVTMPFGYLAATGLRPQPPLALAQARAFEPTGVVCAFDRLYDHASPRIFFRSSPWGAESHAHPDQNSFVLHAGGEIFAADTGYYTYYGDENYSRIASHTIAHNSVLVDGRGQLNDRRGRGRIAGFFNAPDYVFMAGDASEAYDGALDRFRRDILFIRPDVFLLADELHAPRPAEFTWMLNTFAEPRIDAAAREFSVVQRAEAMWGRQLFPETLTYTASNARLAPMQSQVWSRYTEAFPEPWRLRVTTPASDTADILTLLHSHRAGAAPRVRVQAAQRDAATEFVALAHAGGRDAVLFRRHLATSGALSAGNVTTDGRLAAVGSDTAGRLVRWLAIDATHLDEGGRPLFRASRSVQVAWGTPAAAAGQLCVTTNAEVQITLPMTQAPRQLWLAPAEQIPAARPLASRWSAGVAAFALPAGTWTVLVDPVVPPGSRPAELALGLRGGGRDQRILLETVTVENGDWAASGGVTSPQSGFYEFECSDAAAELVVQDRWDPERSARGRGKLRAFVAEGTEVIVRFAPSSRLPELRAKLAQAVATEEVNLLRNGDCEAGLPGYPPRGWTVQDGAASAVYREDGRQGWPGWSQEQAAGGRAALKFTRPLNVVADWRPPYRVMARNQMIAMAPPVRLLHPGRYRLSCAAKGTATTASVMLETSAGVRHPMPLGPSADWTPRRLELDLPAGHTQVSVRFSEGGSDDQLLWVDEIRLVALVRGS